jgi:hypothetical protein
MLVDCLLLLSDLLIALSRLDVYQDSFNVYIAYHTGPPPLELAPRV